MWRRGTPGFSWSRSCWDRPLTPFQSIALHSPCPFGTHTFGPGQRTATQRWKRQTEWPGNSTERLDRSPPKKERENTFLDHQIKYFPQNKRRTLANNGFGSYLNVERASQLVAALSLHGLYLSVVEGVEGKMLHFTVVLVREG